MAACLAVLTGLTLTPPSASADEDQSNESTVTFNADDQAETSEVDAPFETPSDQTDDQSLDQSTDQPEELPLDQSTDQLETQPFDQTDDQSLDQSTDQPEELPIDQSTDQLETQPLDQSATTTDESTPSTEDQSAEPKAEPAEPVVPSSINTDPTRFESEHNDVMLETMRKYDGMTIVDIEFEGASDKTLPTAKAAMVQHIGDNFNVAAAQRDSVSLMNTGYYYDSYVTFEEVPEGVIIKYHMLENPILRGVEISGNEMESTEDLNKVLTMRHGEVLNSSVLQEDIQELQERYREDGYILMKVTDMNLDKDGILHLKINEGILEGYSVKGNKKTKEKVILREMRQKPGEVFNAKSARRSMQRVYNLGFFEDVNLKMQAGVEPNAVIMEINVKEKRTGTFGVGAGYSSEDGIIGMVSIADTNFRGVGDAISASYEMSGDDEDAHGFTFSFRRPWLDRHETAGTFRIYNRTYEYSDYNERGRLNEEYMRKYSGGEFTFGRPISEYSTNYVTMRHRKDKYVKHTSSGRLGNRSGDEGASWRRDNFGTTRSVTLEHITDTRDNIYNPTEGNRVNLSAEFGGLLGGDFDFQKYGIDHQRFIKAGHVQVWAARLKYGIGYGDISEFNQYRIGGQDTLRGYREDQFRGDRMTAGTLEYRFPLFSKVQGALFTDWGAAWNTGWTPDDFHGSVGMGIALQTPLGPLRLDYGRGSQGGRVHFSVGGAF